MKPRVSIIIPTYNRSRFLCETVNSVLEQSVTDIRCNVNDDGSSDGTNDMVGEFCARDARVRSLVRSKQIKPHAFIIRA
jgi:glycosyltransferase involved in cell wall biosynthesis